MNKTIIININSIVFHIEEDAYEILRSYMIDIKRHFGRSEDSKEILEDIENRIAEMFSERIHSGKKEVIGIDDVNQVIAQMGRVSDFEAGIISDEEEFSATTDAVADPGAPSVEAEEPAPKVEPSYFAKKLMKDPDDKILGGVCSGLGHYFGIEPKWVRIMFLTFFLFAGSGAMLYVVLWIFMPKAVSRADKMAMRGEAPNLQNFKKSYEMDEQSGQLSGAREYFGRGARSVESFIGSFFRIIGRFFGIILLISVGLSLLGLFIFFIFCGLYLIGFKTDMHFPPLELLDASDAYVALLAGFLANFIPFMALFYLLLRILFKAPKMNNYASLTLLTVWGLSIIAIIYFCVATAQNFRETSTIKVEKPLRSASNYIFSEKDVRVIDASSEDFDNGRLKAIEDGFSLRDDLSIRIESLDSLEKPFVQYNYTAKGRTFKQASDNASDIAYQMKQDGSNLVFDSHFLFSSKKKLYRDQRIDVSVFLPVGTKVTIMNNMDHRVRNSVWIHDCYPGINHKSTEWIMTKNGLKCATADPDKDEDEKNVEEDVTSES